MQRLVNRRTETKLFTVQQTGYWNVNNTLTVSTGVADPWGGTTACTLTANGAASYLGRSYTGTASVAYTGSLWIRRRTGTGSIGLRIGDNTTTFITGSVTSAWTRIPVTSTPSTTTVRFYIVVSTSGDAIDVWGAQLELGSFATSYIPNDAVSQNIRYADVATMTGTNFSDWYNQSEGAIAIEAFSQVDLITGKFANAYWISDGTQNNKYECVASASYGATGWGNFSVKENNISQASVSGSGVKGQFNKFCATYKANSFAGSANGTFNSEDTAGTIPTVDRLYLGGSSSVNNYLNGWIKSFRYWPQRIINAETTAFSK